MRQLNLRACATPTVLIAALLGAGSARAAMAVPSDHPVSTGPSLRALRGEMLQLLNSDRAAAGVGPLVSDYALTRVALNQSRDMERRHFFDHTNPDGADPAARFSRAGIHFVVSEENLARAMGYSPVQAMTVIDRAMMSEPLVEGSHHANIVDPQVRHVGIGICLAPDNTVYLTEDFTN